jgi:hypothetical protein
MDCCNTCENDEKYAGVAGSYPRSDKETMLVMNKRKTCRDDPTKINEFRRSVNEKIQTTAAHVLQQRKE